MKPTDRDEAAEKLAPLVKQMFENLSKPFYLEMISVNALERMVKYKAHIKAGFTEAQALELCKS